VDHAAIHVAHCAEKAQSDLAASARNGASSVEVTLPALRTTGLALHHTDREAQVGLRFANSAAWSGGNTFVAEDLVRGFRVDVRTVPPTRTANNGWQSLCARQTTFSFTNASVAPIQIADEGYVKSSAMSSASSDPVYNVQEALFHWDGWSLVTSRPGLSVGAATAGGPDGPVVPSNAGASVNLPFTNTSVPQAGSLTKLRFGTRYQLRVRAVDLAGNDMMLAAAADNPRPHASPAITFSRYEPVAPPVLQLRRALTEGESVERLVIRSDPYGPTPLGAADWAARYSASPAGLAESNAGMNAYYPTCERHVAPPKTSVQMAEWHGAFEAALAKPTVIDKVQSGWALASKEDGGFYDAMVTDSTTGQYRTLPQPGRAIVTPPFSLPLVQAAQAANQPNFTGTEDVTPRGTPLQNGQYVVFDADAVVLPYLPDPNAAGVALQGLPTTLPPYRSFGGTDATGTWGTAWPELAVWRLVLAEGSGAPTGLDPAPSASTPVTVFLPPASELQLTYSSRIANATLHAFCPSAAGDQANAANGLLPLLSPQRRIALVHAVQHPKAPGLVDGDLLPQDRAQGQTTQTILTTYRFDGASSAHVDLLATWDEYVDGATGDPTQPIPHQGAIDTITPGPTETLVQNRTVRQLFGDTKRRDIRYATRATTRFREYFPLALTSNSANITTQTSLVNTITCKSSARPPVPKVLYTVPSFVLTPPATAPGVGATATTTRTGGIVRVYCDRGWYATGAGECLGVVLAAQPGDAMTLPSLVSQWGDDPIWQRGQRGVLDISHVNLATTAGIYTNVALAEGAGLVNVATFAPSFNLARGLWYFDIGLNTDQSYFPFLRLALVRYQPMSIFDPSDPTGVAKLDVSQVVLSEFVQLSATRSASVANSGSGNYYVSLTGTTAANIGSPSGLAQAASGHAVTAEFQEATTASPDDIDWTTIGSVTLLPPSASGNATVTYGASMSFPAYAAIPGAKHRILIKEYEVYATDPQIGVQQGVGVVQVGQPLTPYTQRVVYADAVAIPS
jgi:hypothetical protein